MLCKYSALSFFNHRNQTSTLCNTCMESVNFGVPRKSPKSKWSYIRKDTCQKGKVPFITDRSQPILQRPQRKRGECEVRSYRNISGIYLRLRQQGILIIMQNASYHLPIATYTNIRNTRGSPRCEAAGKSIEQKPRYRRNVTLFSKISKSKVKVFSDRPRWPQWFRVS